MSAQRDCIHGHLARSCELCAAQNDHATACEQIDRLRAENERLKSLLRRYRSETPLGHQPHMIAAEVDAALAEARA